MIQIAQSSRFFQQGYAVIIGIGQDLPNTVIDAQGLADILRDEERCAYPADQVHLLVGEQATRDRILARLAALSQETTAESTVIIYFSGHGYRVETGGTTSNYLMAYGYDLQRLAETAVSGEEFAHHLQQIPAQKMLLLLDCCHAGSFQQAKSVGMQLTKSPLPPEVKQTLMQGRGRLTLASSRADELSYTGSPYSAFTRALIESLCGKGVSATEEGFVRVFDLFGHTREVVPQWTQGKQHPTTDQFTQVDNFPIAYFAGGGPVAKGLPQKLATGSLQFGLPEVFSSSMPKPSSSNLPSPLDIKRQQLEARYAQVTLEQSAAAEAALMAIDPVTELKLEQRSNQLLQELQSIYDALQNL